MRYIVAVSGGVDSVVLLDRLVRDGVHELVVAHFDHGIRPESDADARFCRALAAQYGLPFETCREELGETASEATARARRYVFLRRVAEEYGAKIATAHHRDDLIETMAINLTRGTGWRGIAVFGDNTIERPLLSEAKAAIYDYALRYNLEWVEDETNQTDAYLRNRLRARLSSLPADSRQQLIELYGLQSQLRLHIDKLVEQLVVSVEGRAAFRQLDEVVALELLRQKTDGRLTRPQLRRFLEGLKSLPNGSRMTLGGKLMARLGRETFSIQPLESTGKR